jgi:hypothetical protein
VADRVFLRTTERASGPAIAPLLPTMVDRTLDAPGRSLEARTRKGVEARFGQDFSQVRVHSDSTAAWSAELLGANAYAVGNHIVMNSTRGGFDISARQRLMIHELAHVVQQTSGVSAGGSRDRITSEGPERGEREAQGAVRDFLGAAQMRPLRSTPVRLACEAFTSSQTIAQLAATADRRLLSRLSTARIDELIEAHAIASWRPGADEHDAIVTAIQQEFRSRLPALDRGQIEHVRLLTQNDATLDQAVTETIRHSPAQSRAVDRSSGGEAITDLSLALRAPVEHDAAQQAAEQRVRQRETQRQAGEAYGEMRSAQTMSLFMVRPPRPVQAIAVVAGAMPGAETMASALDHPEEILDFALHLVPILGTALDVCESLTGRVVVTGRDLSDGERALSGVLALIGLIPLVSAAARGVRGGVRAVRAAQAVQLAETLRNLHTRGALPLEHALEAIRLRTAGRPLLPSHYQALEQCGHLFHEIGARPASRGLSRAGESAGRMAAGRARAAPVRPISSPPSGVPRTSPSTVVPVPSAAARTSRVHLTGGGEALTEAVRARPTLMPQTAPVGRDIGSPAARPPLRHVRNVRPASLQRPLGTQVRPAAGTPSPPSATAVAQSRAPAAPANVASSVAISSEVFRTVLRTGEFSARHSPMPAHLPGQQPAVPVSDPSVRTPIAAPGVLPPGAAVREPRRPERVVEPGPQPTGPMQVARITHDDPLFSEIAEAAWRKHMNQMVNMGWPNVAAVELNIRLMIRHAVASDWWHRDDPEAEAVLSSNGFVVVMNLNRTPLADPGTCFRADHNAGRRWLASAGFSRGRLPGR